ncbi:hypothetical protein ACUXZZ_45245 (plasmid) [Streptomyces graminifolii]|uniref:hypothetical protein n=1 Tax=Streptomyces graminifolii TaxID=1266771 RepID=UPI004058F29C
MIEAIAAAAAAGQNFRDAVDKLVAQIGEQHLPAMSSPPESQQLTRNLFSIYARSYGRLNRRNYDPDPAVHSDWVSVLLESAYDVVREAGPAQQRNRLVILAALCQAWAADIDRTTTATEQQ